MSALSQSYLSPEEYLAVERQAEYRSEYFAGEMFAKPATSETHSLIRGNLIVSLHTQLRGGPCRTFAKDMRVRITATDVYTYPDIVVVCGERLFEDDEKDTLLNPKLIIEVERNFDLVPRPRITIRHYTSIPSLQEYVLVVPDQPAVHQYQPMLDSSWRYMSSSGLDASVNLASVNVSLALTDIYEEVAFT